MNILSEQLEQKEREKDRNEKNHENCRLQYNEENMNLRKIHMGIFFIHIGLFMGWFSVMTVREGMAYIAIFTMAMVSLSAGIVVDKNKRPLVKRLAEKGLRLEIQLSEYEGVFSQIFKNDNERKWFLWLFSEERGFYFAYGCFFVLWITSVFHRFLFWE